MRLLICAGGTGGGVYPALAVLQALESENKPEILWVGGLEGMEADLVRRRGIAYKGIPAAGVHGVSVWTMPRNLWQIGRGLLAARRILRRFRPNVLLFTGGYVAVPVSLASRLPGLGIPAPGNLLFVPDIEPGWALKILARFADHIAVTVAESKRFFQIKKDVTVVGYPVRKDLRSWNRTSALGSLQLSADLPVLLVFGGSTGARSINRALLPILPELLEEMQVVHISGQRDWAEVENAMKYLPGNQLARYRAFPYVHGEMGAALAAADLAVSRAGASSLGEFPLFGLPAILVPYPYAWRYQEVNAQFLAVRGAAVVVADQDLPDQLLTAIRDLIRDKVRREQMSQAMSSVAEPEAAKSISRILYSLVEAKTQREV